MKYFILFLLSGALFASCNFNVNTSSDSQSNEKDSIIFQTVTELVGKTIAYQYGESIYHVTFDTDSTMHWEAVAGDEKGALEHETYVATFFEPNKLFISWGEANGINVSQVLDFGEGKVFNHLVKERKASSGTGEISIVVKQ